MALEKKEELLACIEEAISAERKDENLLHSYIQECSQLGLEILPCDINSSCKTTVFEGEQQLRFGFSAFISADETFVEDIVSERRQHGKFNSFQDFCERLEPGDIPDHFFLNCIEAGAFDSTGASRSQLFHGYEKIIDAVRHVKEQKASQQISLFAAVQTPTTAALIKLPDTDDWTEEERIAHEKHALGFSLTEFSLLQEESEADTTATPVQEKTPEEPVASQINDAQHPQELSEEAQPTAVPLIEETTASEVREEQSEAYKEEETAESKEPLAEVISVEKNEGLPEDTREEPAQAERRSEETLAETAQTPSDAAQPDRAEDTTIVEVQSPRLSAEKDAMPTEFNAPAGSSAYDATPPLPPEEFTAEEYAEMPSRQLLTHNEEHTPSEETTTPQMLQYPPAPAPLEEKKLPEDTTEPSQTLPASALLIRLNVTTTTEATLLQLRTLLEQHSGDIDVLLEFFDDSQSAQRIKTHSDYAVSLSEQMRQEIETISGQDTTTIIKLP